VSKLEATLWLQLERGNPLWTASIRVARVTARKPRQRIPGTRLAKLTITVPAEAFSDELPAARIDLDAGQLSPPYVAVSAEPAEVWMETEPVRGSGATREQMDDLTRGDGDE
jgi:hypothetical protein